MSDKNKKFNINKKTKVGNNTFTNSAENNEKENNKKDLYKDKLALTNLQLKKQDIIQKISNSTMCHAFSTAEFLVLRICNENKTINNIWSSYINILGNNKLFKPYKPIFAAYDAFDGGKNKPIKDLICQLIFQIENFKEDYMNYKKKNNGKYDFPSNLSFEQVVKIIILWSNELKNIDINKGKFSEYGSSKYLDNLFNLIMCRPTIDYSTDIYNLEANNPNREKFDLEALKRGNALAQNQIENFDLKNPENKEVYLFGDNQLVDNDYSSSNAYL